MESHAWPKESVVFAFSREGQLEKWGLPLSACQTTHGSMVFHFPLELPNLAHTRPGSPTCKGGGAGGVDGPCWPWEGRTRPPCTLESTAPHPCPVCPTQARLQSACLQLHPFPLEPSPPRAVPRPQQARGGVMVGVGGHLPAASTLKPPLPHPDMPGLAAGWSCTHIGAPHGARHDLGF